MTFDETTYVCKALWLQSAVGFGCFQRETPTKWLLCPEDLATQQQNIVPTPVYCHTLKEIPPPPFPPDLRVRPFFCRVTRVIGVGLAYLSGDHLLSCRDWQPLHRAQSSCRPQFLTEKRNFAENLFTAPCCLPDAVSSSPGV